MSQIRHSFFALQKIALQLSMVKKHPVGFNTDIIL